MHWKPFKPANGGESVDLSYANAHRVTYVHNEPGKDPITYEFYVTYSCHVFAKDYPELTEQERADLIYHAPKESRPFCYRRHVLARQYLRAIIENLGAEGSIVQHAGHGGYATAEVVTEDNKKLYYFVPFKVFKERKKLRLHVVSAYPLTDRPNGKRVKFFTIAWNLLRNRPMPRPPR